MTKKSQTEVETDLICLIDKIFEGSVKLETFKKDLDSFNNSGYEVDKFYRLYEDMRRYLNEWL